MIKIKGKTIYTKNIHTKTSENDEYNANKYIFNIIPDMKSLELSKNEDMAKDEVVKLITERLKEVKEDNILQFTPSNYPFNIIDFPTDERVNSGASVEVVFNIEYKEKYKNNAFIVKGIKVIKNGKPYNPFDEF